MSTAWIAYLKSENWDEYWYNMESLLPAIIMIHI